MRQSDAINELAAALATAQAEIRGAVKDSVNPHFKNKYADLSAVWEACRAPITKHGLSVVQTLGSEVAGCVRITTMLLHRSGQWIADDLQMPAGATAQTAGSAITYGRRYALAAIVGVAPEDDDGNTASGNKPQPAAAVESAKVLAPVGYAEWWNDMNAAADTGIDTLSEAWKASRAEFRAYTLGSNRELWDALKARAQRVSQ